MFRYYNWEEVIFNWEDVHMNWEEVGIIEEILKSGGLFSTVKPLKENDFLRLKSLNELPKEKKRKIIKIACKLTENDEYISYKYKNEDIKITAEHVNIIINAARKNKIKIDVQNIS